ncbi:MAG: hypothetical protein J6T06_12960, partial [Victivallales bacterium]|nr:hypothetical protein [Victivallales bacterium]
RSVHYYTSRHLPWNVTDEMYRYFLCNDGVLGSDGGTPSLPSRRQDASATPNGGDAVVTIAKAGRLRHTKRRDAGRHILSSSAAPMADGQWLKAMVFWIIWSFWILWRRFDPVNPEHPVNPVDFFCQLWQIINLYFAKTWLCEVVLADYRLYFAKTYVFRIVLADYRLYFAKTWFFSGILAEYKFIFRQNMQNSCKT